MRPVNVLVRVLLSQPSGNDTRLYAGIGINQAAATSVVDLELVLKPPFILESYHLFDYSLE
jgi:hypothetical protein